MARAKQYLPFLMSSLFGEERVRDLDIEFNCHRRALSTLGG